MNNDGTRGVIDKLGDQPGETLTPERVEAIQTAMHEDLGRFINTTSYFVLGSYGEKSGHDWRLFATNSQAMPQPRNPMPKSTRS